MPDLSIAPAWTALFLGLFAAAAGLGEFRRPGVREAMMGEIAASPTLQFLLALLELFLGAVIYLANPWRAADWLSPAMNLVGGAMCVEALLILIAGDRFARFWVRHPRAHALMWSWGALGFGLLLIALGALRF